MIVSSHSTPREHKERNSSPGSSCKGVPGNKPEIQPLCMSNVELVWLAPTSTNGIQGQQDSEQQIKVVPTEAKMVWSLPGGDNAAAGHISVVHVTRGFSSTQHEGWKMQV